MPATRRLNRYSHQCKFSFPYFFLLISICLSNARPSSFTEIEAARHRALVSASAAECKKKEKEGSVKTEKEREGQPSTQERTGHFCR